jgi:hypothetical protein
VIQEIEQPKYVASLKEVGHAVLTAVQDEFGEMYSVTSSGGTLSFGKKPPTKYLDGEFKLNRTHVTTAASIELRLCIT